MLRTTFNISLTFSRMNYMQCCAISSLCVISWTPGRRRCAATLGEHLPAANCPPCTENAFSPKAHAGTMRCANVGIPLAFANHYTISRGSCANDMGGQPSLHNTGLVACDFFHRHAILITAVCWHEAFPHAGAGATCQYTPSWAACAFPATLQTPFYPIVVGIGMQACTFAIACHICLFFHYHLIHFVLPLPFSCARRLPLLYTGEAEISSRPSSFYYSLYLLLIVLTSLFSGEKGSTYTRAYSPLRPSAPGMRLWRRRRLRLCQHLRGATRRAAKRDAALPPRRAGSTSPRPVTLPQWRFAWRTGRTTI